MDILSLCSIALKFMFYLGALLASGTVFYLMLFETNQAKSSFNSRQMAGLFACIGLISALSGYAVTAANLTGELAGAFDPLMLSILLQTQIGTALLLRVLGLSLILVCVFTVKLNSKIAVIGSLVVLWSFTEIGHVANTPNHLFQILLLVHLIGITIWIGVLLPLYRLSSNPAQIETLGDIAYRFGRLALFFLPLLLLAGGLLAYRLLNSFENLFTTGYGQALLVKIAIVIGLLGLATANKFRFVPALRTGDLDAQNHLKYSVLVEIVLVVFILFTTAVLTSVLTLPEVHS